jgi:phospholipase/carboxylesterase
MIKSDIFKLPHLQEPSRKVMLFHGVGSNAEDLISLSEYFPQNNDIVFVSPNGPENFDMANFGYQWFSLQNRSKEHIKAGLEKASESLSLYVKKKLLDHNISRDKLIVVGFSQGAMLAMHHFLEVEEKIAGVVAISGALIEGDKNFVSKPNMLIMHEI